MNDISNKKTEFNQEAFNYAIINSLGSLIKTVDHNANMSNKLEKNVAKLSGRMFWLNATIVGVCYVCYAGYKVSKEVTKLQKEVEELKRMKGE